MSSAPLTILQVNWASHGGGAEQVAYALHHAMLRDGHDAWLAVSKRTADEPRLLQIRERAGPGTRVIDLGATLACMGGRISGTSARISRRLATVATPSELVDFYLGREHFGFASTEELLGTTPTKPDLLHLHNLHGGYFDLRKLGSLSRRCPVLLTLHDEWTFTGHCGSTLGCERWRSGCGSCPRLDVYPAIRRDSTNRNLEVKLNAYREAGIYVSGPSRWIVGRARDSVLSEGVLDWRVIPNGVDQSVFRPGDRARARAMLGLPSDARILLFVANYARTSPYKDFATVAAATRLLADENAAHTVLVVLGEHGASEEFPGGEIQFVPYRGDRSWIALYYQSADLYLHGSKAETAGLTILEAQSCGVPVVATAVGGVVDGLSSLDGAPGAWNGPSEGPQQATGVLVDPGDASGMASAAAFILGHADVWMQLSANAVARAREHFGMATQVAATVSWYRDAITDWKARQAS